VTDRIDALQADLSNGVIAVPEVPAGPPTMLPDHDTTMHITLREGACLVDDEELTVGSDVRVEFENTTTSVAGGHLFAGAGVTASALDGFGLFARPGATNAGVIRIGRSGPWTVVCDQNFDHLVASVEVNATM
jgi:hypothetical protein